MVGRPWNADVELTEGCSRYCSFCGISAIRSGPGDYKFASVRTMTRVARELSQLNSRLRVEFAGHGEPLLNPDHLEIIRRFRAMLPRGQLLVTTNGATLRGHMRGRLRELFDAGLNLVLLDTYEPERRALQSEAQQVSNEFRVLDYYKDCLPAGWSPWANHNGKVNRTLVVIDDISLRNGESTTRTIDNRGGNSPQSNHVKPLEKTCTMPFRTLFVKHSGKALLCCMDWAQSFVAGDIVEEGAWSVWHGYKLEAARAILGSKNREFRPCSRCDKHAGPRAGLLPKYPPPTARQLAVARGKV